MNKKLMRLSLLGVVFVLVFAFGAAQTAQAQSYALTGPPCDQMRVDLDRDLKAPEDSCGQIEVNRDFGSFTMFDVNRFGDDRAYSSATRGTDRDADFQYFHWTPDTYGLNGTYGYYSSNGGGGS